MWKRDLQFLNQWQSPLIMQSILTLLTEGWTKYRGLQTVLKSWVISVSTCIHSLKKSETYVWKSQFYVMQLTYPWWKPRIWSCVTHYMMWCSMFSRQSSGTLNHYIKWWVTHLVLITSPQRSYTMQWCVVPCHAHSYDWLDVFSSEIKYGRVAD